MRAKTDVLGVQNMRIIFYPRENASEERKKERKKERGLVPKKLPRIFTFNIHKQHTTLYFNEPDTFVFGVTESIITFINHMKPTPVGLSSFAVTISPTESVEPILFGTAFHPKKTSFAHVFVWEFKTVPERNFCNARETSRFLSKMPVS